MRTGKRHKWTGFEIFSTVTLSILLLLIVIPFWNAVVISLETPAAYSQKPFSWLPGEFTLDNYLRIAKPVYLNTGYGSGDAFGNDGDGYGGLCIFQEISGEKASVFCDGFYHVFWRRPDPHLSADQADGDVGHLQYSGTAWDDLHLQHHYHEKRF